MGTHLAITPQKTAAYLTGAALAAGALLLAGPAATAFAGPTGGGTSGDVVNQIGQFGSALVNQTGQFGSALVNQTGGFTNAFVNNGNGFVRTEIGGTNNVIRTITGMKVSAQCNASPGAPGCV